MKIPEHEIKTESASLVKTMPLCGEIIAAPPARYKCESCFAMFDEKFLVDGRCPECGGEQILKTCEHDHACECSLDVTGGMTKCPTCGAYTCPCGSHNVIVISRITGYMQPLSGWNAAKVAEFEDRTRYDDVA